MIAEPDLRRTVVALLAPAVLPMRALLLRRTVLPDRRAVAIGVVVAGAGCRSAACVIERMTASLWARWARRGRCSQIRKPGTLV